MNVIKITTEVTRINVLEKMQSFFMEQINPYQP